MTVKIAFYGEREKIGTTSNMLSLAWMMVLKNPNWSVFIEEKDRRYVLWKAVSEEERILFTDCGTGTTISEKNRLKQADLIVVNLPSELSLIESRFIYDAPVKRNVFFLVGNYLGRKKELVHLMKNSYRVREQDVGWIPYNNEFAYFLEMEKGKEFIGQYQKKQVAEHNRCFFEEIERSIFLLQKKMELQTSEKRR